VTAPENIESYIVRLVMKVDAPKGEPDTAVGNFVDLLTANGLRDWVFRVEDQHTGDVLGYFDGYGDPVEIQVTTPTEEPPAPEPVGATPATPEQPAPAQAATTESDESLVALAESLNENQ
jgi:hypothetical protein